VSNPSKQRGTAWESEIVSFLKSCGWPYVERRTLSGNKDRGDIAGIPGVVIEAKATKTAALAAHLDEANLEAENDGANLGAVWMKRRGHASAGNGYVIVDGWTFAALLNSAGYGGGSEPLTTTVATGTQRTMPTHAEYYQAHRDDPDEWGDPVTPDEAAS
jgi:hypothetical protein